jgi:hypothetical protein
MGMVKVLDVSFPICTLQIPVTRGPVVGSEPSALSLPYFSIGAVHEAEGSSHPGGGPRFLGLYAYVPIDW